MDNTSGRVNGPHAVAQLKSWTTYRTRVGSMDHTAGQATFLAVRKDWPSRTRIWLKWSRRSMAAVASNGSPKPGTTPGRLGCW